MTNIEVYGITNGITKKLIQINKIMENTAFEKDYVITFIKSTVTDRDDQPKPFIRVVSTPENIDNVVELLKPLNMDIEVLELKEFIPNF